MSPGKIDYRDLGTRREKRHLVGFGQPPPAPHVDDAPGSGIITDGYFLVLPQSKGS